MSEHGDAAHGKHRKSKHHHHHHKSSEGGHQKHHHHRKSVKTKVPPEFEARLQEAFQMCDASHDGRINKRELVIALKKHPDIAEFFHLPSHIRQEDGTRDAMEHFFQEIDEDHNREISWEELFRHASLFASGAARSQQKDDEFVPVNADQPTGTDGKSKRKERKSKLVASDFKSQSSQDHEPSTDSINKSKRRERKSKVGALDFTGQNDPDHSEPSGVPTEFGKTLSHGSTGGRSKRKERKSKVGASDFGGPSSQGHSEPSKWAVYSTFPCGKDDRVERNQLFDNIDVSRVGSLTLEDLETGLRRHYHIPEAASSLLDKGFESVSITELGTVGTLNVVDRKGFRTFLEYISHTFEVMDAFQTSSDSLMTPERSIDVLDLHAAAPRLCSLGIPVEKGKEIDIFDIAYPKHDGSIILSRFCDWASKEMLKMDPQARQERRQSHHQARQEKKEGHLDKLPEPRMFANSQFPPMPSFSDLIKKDLVLKDPSWQQQLRHDAAQVDALGDDFRKLVVSLEQKAHDMKVVLYDVFSDPWTAFQEPSASRLLEDVTAGLIDMQNDLKQIEALKECFKGSNLVECQQHVIETLLTSQSSIESFLALQTSDAQQILTDSKSTSEKYARKICESDHMLNKLQNGAPLEFVDPESCATELDAQQKMLDSSHKMIQYFLAVCKPHLNEIVSKTQDLTDEEQMAFQFLNETLRPRHKAEDVAHANHSANDLESRLKKMSTEEKLHRQSTMHHDLQSRMKSMSTDDKLHRQSTMHQKRATKTKV